MGDFTSKMKINSGVPSVEELVDDYLNTATNVYLSEFESGSQDHFDQLSLDILRKQLKVALSKVNPVDLASLYSSMMDSNMGRIKAIEKFGEDATMKDVAVWCADAKAFMDIIFAVRNRRYDFKDACFVEDGKEFIESPIDMIEEMADYSMHNDRIKRTASQEHDLICTLFAMRSNIDSAIADMTTEQVDQFKGLMKLKKVSYDNALSKHIINSEYCNTLERCAVSPLIQGELNQLLWLQKEYNVDMVRKYSDRKNGLIPYVDNIDEHIDDAIMGLN